MKQMKKNIVFMKNNLLMFINKKYYNKVIKDI